MNKYSHLQRAIQQGRRKARMCANKKAFDSEGDARQKGQRHYQCPYCNKWHRSGSLAKFIAAMT